MISKFFKLKQLCRQFLWQSLNFLFSLGFIKSGYWIANQDSSYRFSKVLYRFCWWKFLGFTVVFDSISAHIKSPISSCGCCILYWLQCFSIRCSSRWISLSVIMGIVTSLSYRGVRHRMKLSSFQKRIAQYCLQAILFFAIGLDSSSFLSHLPIAIYAWIGIIDPPYNCSLFLGAPPSLRRKKLLATWSPRQFQWH